MRLHAVIPVARSWSAVMIERIIVALCRSWQPDVWIGSLPSSPPSLFFTTPNRMPHSSVVRWRAIGYILGGEASSSVSGHYPLPNRSCSYLASYESFSSVI
jgi:hypothetical protein